MSFIYLFIKIYPFFGLSMAFVCLDLARNFKRKGDAKWIAFLAMSFLSLVTTALWIYFRGDKNTEIWILNFQHWVQGV